MRGGVRAQALIYVLLIAFAGQIALTRSHFHFGGATDGTGFALSDDALGGGLQGDTKAPLHDETDCPIWHAAGVCGGAIFAVAASLIGPVTSQSRVPIDARVVFPERFAASWRSRGPPSL